jgi:1-acyl-sn-glycerol-3-phosphate acyltransferase
MTPKKTIYYDNLLEDEFSGTKIERKPLPENYKYYRKNPFYRAFAWFIYYLIAFPIIYLVVRFYGYRIKGAKKMRKLMHHPIFFYGNHTQIIDAVTAQVNVSRGKRTYIVCNQDTTSIKGIRWLVTMLGCLAAPENPEEHEKFVAAIRYRIKQKCAISIFPEAHIWPYSTHIRPFGDDAFYYPAELNTPCVAMVMTYRERRFFKNHRPLPVIHVSRPIYPDMNLSLPDRKKDLRNKIYEFMLDYSSSEENIEWVSYQKRPAGEENKQ